MKRMPVVLIIVFLLISNSSFAGTTGISRIYDTSWLKDTALKWSYYGSLFSYQATSGLIEGYKYSQETKHVVQSHNYHAFLTAKDVMGIATGWTLYANWKDTKLSKWTKVRRTLAGLCLGRNIREWSYKAQRYANPFDYTEAHNEHSLVYFGFRGGKLVDLYIGTGPVTGPAVDTAFAALFILLNR